MSKYYFIHIRKTAGTSMRQFLTDNVKRKNICPELSQVELYSKRKSEERKDYLEQFQLISGHYYSVPVFFKEPRITFTILRDPIARTLSEINQITNDKRDIYHKFLKEHNDISDIFDDSRFDKAINNSQIRYLISNAGRIYDNLSDKERLKVALTYLKNLDFFGLTENFDSSIVMLAIQFGWKIPKKTPQLNLKITENGFKKNSNLKFIKQLHDNNTLDLALYREAQKIFDKRLSEFLKSMIKSDVSS